MKGENESIGSHDESNDSYAEYIYFWSQPVTHVRIIVYLNDLIGSNPGWRK